jgi:hypothetical protein
MRRSSIPNAPEKLAASTGASERRRRPLARTSKRFDRATNPEDRNEPQVPGRRTALPVPKPRANDLSGRCVRGARGRRGLRRCRQQRHACDRMSLGGNRVPRLRFEDTPRGGTGRLAHVSERADHRPAVLVAVTAAGQGVAVAARRILCRSARGGGTRSGSLGGCRSAGVRHRRRKAASGRWVQMRALPVQPAEAMRHRQLVHRRAKMRDRAHQRDERCGDPDGERTIDGEVTHARARTRRRREDPEPAPAFAELRTAGGCLTQLRAVVKRRPPERGVAAGVHAERRCRPGSR